MIIINLRICGFHHAYDVKIKDRNRLNGEKGKHFSMSIDLFCFVDCADGYYGASCYKCGHCANNSVCNRTSGHCPASFEVPFQPPLCKSRKNPQK